LAILFPPKIRDEFINRKALVTEEASYIQINFSIYFKHKEIHDFAAKRLKIIKKALDNGEPLGNSWKFAANLSLPEHLKIEAPKQK
jgi:hypothetical protein